MSWLYHPKTPAKELKIQTKHETIEGISGKIFRNLDLVLLKSWWKCQKELKRVYNSLLLLFLVCLCLLGDSLQFIAISKQLTKSE